MSWFSSQWNKLSQQLDPNAASNPIRRLEVVWGREVLQVTLPEMETPPKLSDLKAVLSSLTDIPPSNMKLISKGLTLKDDRSSLSSYHLVDGSRVMLVGSNGGPATPVGYEQRKKKGGASSGGQSGGQRLGGGNEGGSGTLTPGEEAARKKKLMEEDTSEEGLLNRIEGVRKAARRDLLPKVLQLEKSVDALNPTKKTETTSTSTTATSQATEAPSTTETSDKEKEISQLPIVGPSSQLSLLQRGTSEMLLRALLSLDGVQVQSEATRQARKGAVKEIQGWLDRVDSARERGVKLNWEGKSKV